MYERRLAPFVDWGMRSEVGLSLSGGVCEGVEHALPDLVGWGVDARGG
jgi:hypothetical protein